MKNQLRRVLYIDDLHEQSEPHRAVSLRTGSAGFVFATDDGGFRNDLRLELSANSTHALIGHGVVDALNDLSLHGRVGTGMEVLIPPSELEAVQRLFYRADAKTYGANYEFVVESRAEVEYRIRIDNREYQNTLSGMQYLLRTAAHEGMAAWLLI